jgi:hypothetical protein
MPVHMTATSADSLLRTAKAVTPLTIAPWHLDVLQFQTVAPLSIEERAVLLEASDDLETLPRNLNSRALYACCLRFNALLREAH